MGFFNWAAPIFGRFADRWGDLDIVEIADVLRPYVPEDGSLLDVGGGTGALAQRLSAALSAHVTVLDPTPEMLSYLPKNDRVTGVLGCAEAMPFDDDSFDAIIATNAFHHFPDQPAAVREFRRVVRPGGGVVVLELDPSGPLMRLVALVEKALGEPGAFLTQQQMCAFMAEHGITGRCERIRGAMYRFSGVVRD